MYCEEETPEECYNQVDYTDEINDLVSLIVPLAIRDETVENWPKYILFMYQNYSATVFSDNTVIVVVSYGADKKEYREDQMVIEEHVLELIEKERKCL